ncbi:hypothetical protein LAZ67_10002771 [Cordylochernes scorpioides]|uniref:Transposase n=1 Tax=Cordylochernes scorpioides TaxID=51811 RepID=A0ABY6KZL3_9ARAC|nr:hypothetical protein LAZ67_10002771 [Cordylochernes scorpioides]
MPGHRKRRQFKQTDAFTRGMVIGLKRAGWFIRQIAADTHLGASMVHRLWRRWLEQGNVAIYRNVGATRVTSARVDRRILRQAVAAPHATCTAILQHVQDTLDHSISTRTISRRLVANGLHSCRPLRKLPLTPQNRRQRLEWCRARSTWMTEWHRVVFSDESRFCLSSDSRRVRVWRRRGERSNPAAIVERPTVRQRGIMVWGAIAYDSRSPLLRIQGTMTAQRYVDDVLRPDNARPHTARISQQALQDVQMLPWPPYSPDLSPIEHVWDIIGRRLHALPQPRSEDELWQMVEREWRAIPQDAIRTLIDSLPRRVAACIAVREAPLRLTQTTFTVDWIPQRVEWKPRSKVPVNQKGVDTYKDLAFHDSDPNDFLAWLSAEFSRHTEKIQFHGEKACIKCNDELKNKSVQGWEFHIPSQFILSYFILKPRDRIPHLVLFPEEKIALMSPESVKGLNPPKQFSNSSCEDQRYANPPTGVRDANLAAARGDVTTGSAAATSSNGAARVLGNWADYTEDPSPGADEDFTVIKSRKRRRNSADSPTAAKHHSNPRGAGANSRPRSSTGWVPRAEEIKITRAHIAEARARQASSAEDNCVYVEYSPEFEPYHYIRAVDRMIGGTNNGFQVSKINGHYLMGLNNRGLAERLISEGIEVEGTLFRAFPFRKRAMKITVGNLPFFVEDSTIISALTPYGRVTSIAPKLMKAGPYIYNDGRRDAFIVLHEGVTTERLPTRLEIKIKGEVWPAYLSYGIGCSRWQGHRRANCPLLAGRVNNSRLAPPTSPAGVPSTTTSAPPQRSAAQPPAPAPSSTAMEIPGASHAARAVTPSAAPRPSTPVASAVPMEMAPPAPPPVTPAPSLRAPGSHEPAAPTPDIEMSIVEETSTSSTSSSKTSTRESLVTFIERNPGVSFAMKDALGLGREEVLDILSSKTKARKRGPLLSPSQGGALAGLIRQLLGQRPGGDSNIYKVLRQVLSELRTAPTAVPSTPPLPAPRPAEPTPPAPQRRESASAMAAPPPPPSPHAKVDPVPDRWKVLKIRVKEAMRGPFSDFVYDTSISVNDIVEAVQCPEKRESLLACLSPKQQILLPQF